MTSAPMDNGLSGVSEDEVRRLSTKGIHGWDDLVDVDPLQVADDLALSPDLLVALVAEARRRLATQRPPASMEAIDVLDDGGFVEVPSSTKRDRGARVAARVDAVRARLRKARKRAKKGDAGAKTLRSLKRSLRRLRRLSEELTRHGASRRWAEAVGAVVDRIESALTAFMDRRPSKKRARRLRKRVAASLDRLD